MTPTEALARIADLYHGFETDGSDRRWIDADEVRAVLAEVTPEPGCTLDRDQARDVLWQELGVTATSAALDRLAACVRPVDGDA